MGKTQCVEVLFAHEEQSGVVDCCHRRRIVSAIKDWQLCHRASRSVNAEHLLAAPGRTLKDTDVPGFDNVQAQTGFTFAENKLARCVVARHSALQEKSEFALCQSGKERDLRQRLTSLSGFDYKTRGRQEGSAF